MRASYLELYNEQINDLLNPESTNLQLRAHAQTGVFVENLLQACIEPVAGICRTCSRIAGALRGAPFEESCCWPTCRIA